MHPRELYLKFLFKKYGLYEPMTPERLAELISRDEANEREKEAISGAGR
jgi:hypothetical protein